MTWPARLSLASEHGVDVGVGRVLLLEEGLASPLDPQLAIGDSPTFVRVWLVYSGLRTEL